MMRTMMAEVRASCRWKRRVRVGGAWCMAQMEPQKSCRWMRMLLCCAVLCCAVLCCAVLCCGRTGAGAVSWCWRLARGPARLSLFIYPPPSRQTAAACSGAKYERELVYLFHLPNFATLLNCFILHFDYQQTFAVHARPQICSIKSLPRCASVDRALAALRQVA
jgi:hypothetical protein